LAVLILVAIILGSIFYMGYEYTQIEPEEHCEYEVIYLHTSGRTLTKDVYCPCSGFYHWSTEIRDGGYISRIPFSNGYTEDIIGATDIFSVRKKTPNQ